MSERNADMALPSQIPIFPLPNALLLPEGQLPLNIFEPRYLAMVEDALGAPGRLIGMVQPIDEAGALFGIGCAGRISYFNGYWCRCRAVVRCSRGCPFRCRRMACKPSGY